jgi:hypothetical protein
MYLDSSMFSQISIIISEIEKETTWTETHLNKLHTLRNLRNSPPITKRSTILISPIKNYSKRVLTNEEIFALENGLDFTLPSVTFDEDTFIVNIETLFVNLLGHCSDIVCSYYLLLGNK